MEDGAAADDLAPVQTPLLLPAPADARLALPGWLSGLTLLVGLSAALAFTHQDDMDAAIYAVVARNLAVDGPSFHLRFTPPGALFFEHPPLWLWVLSAVARAAPSVPLGIASTACGALTLGCAWRVGRDLVGPRAAQLGLLLLAADVPFALQHALPRLDAPLTLAFTASVALLVAARGRAAPLLAGGLVAGLGALVKGPPALGAPVAAALVLLATGRGRELRSVRPWLLVGVAAALPPAAFLAYDAAALDGGWARAYLDAQVLASLDGRRRPQFGVGPRYLLSAGLWARARLLAPLALVALAVALRRGDARRSRLALLLWIGVLVLGFGLASRAYWFYTLPAFPPLALLAGAGLDDLLARLGAAGDRLARGGALAGCAAGIVLLMGAPLGILRGAGDACPYGDLPARAAAAAAAGGSLVAVVTSPDDFRTQPLVADHGRCEVARFSTAAEAAARSDVAAIVAPRREPAVPGWREDRATADWALWLRAR